MPSSAKAVSLGVMNVSTMRRNRKVLIIHTPCEAPGNVSESCPPPSRATRHTPEFARNAVSANVDTGSARPPVHVIALKFSRFLPAYLVENERQHGEGDERDNHGRVSGGVVRG